MKGVLAQRCPADILSEVLRRQMSGILSISKDPASRQLFIDAGTTIRFAASSHPEESLVTWLVARGGVSEAHVREATAQKQPHELLGTVLVRLGHLTRQKLVDVTESHIRRVLTSALAMSKGNWEFHEGALPFRDQLDAGVRSAEALLEWTRGLGDSEWVRSRLGPVDTRVHRDRRPPEGYQSIRLDPVEGFIMSLVDGAATIREICMMSPTGDDKTLKALFGLTLAGILEAPPGTEAALPPPLSPRRLAEAGGPVAPYSAATPPAATRPPAATSAATSPAPAPVSSTAKPAAPAPAAPAPARPVAAASFATERPGPLPTPNAAPAPSLPSGPSTPAKTEQAASHASQPVSASRAASSPAGPAPAGGGVKPGAKPGVKPGARPGLRGPVKPGTGRPSARPNSPARPRPVAAPVRPVEPARPPTAAELESEMLARHAELHNQDLYHALGVSSTASTDEIRRAYYALARRYHPDKFRNEAIKAQAEQVFGRITEAYATLSDHDARSRYDGEIAANRGSAQDHAGDTTDIARENFRRGRDELDRGRFAEALAFLMHACEQDPGKSEYFEYLGATQARNPRLRKQAEESLLKALALSPTNAGAYVQLAGLYERAGAAERAREMYRKALEWDPDNPAAKRALGTEQPAKRGGLLGFFGRK